MLAGDFQEIIQDLVAVLRSDALGMELHAVDGQDRKSTRLNSSHGYISYAVFCLKKKKNFHTNSFFALSRHIAALPYNQITVLIKHVPSYTLYGNRPVTLELCNIVWPKLLLAIR